MPRSCGRGLAFLRRSAPRRPPTVGEVLALAGRHPDDWAADEEVPLPVTAVHAQRLPRRPAGGPGRSGDRRRSPRRRASARSCAPTSSGACRGWRSSPSWGWAPAWPTTWAWARPCSCWRWRSHERRRRRARAHPAAVPDVAGRHLAAGGRALRPRACGCARCTGPAARTAPRCTRRWRAPTWSSPRTPPPPATPTSWPRSTGAGSCSTRPRPSRTAGRPAARAVRRIGAGTGSRSPAPPWRTGSPSCGRSWTCSTPACSAPPTASATRYAVPDRAARQRRGGVAAAHDHPALPAAPGQDRPHHHRRPAREDRDHAALPAHPEQATLYRTVVDDMMEKIEDSAGHPAPRQRAGRDDQAQAGLQPPGPAPARRLRRSGGAPARSSGSRRSSPRSWPRATGRCASPSSPSSGTCSCRTCRPGSTPTSRSCTAAPREAPRRDGARGSRRGDGPPVLLLSLKAGGTGLTLTAANHVVHLDRWWNPAVENQATDRAFRIGQRRNVQVRKFLCPGTRRGAHRRA